MSFPLIVITCTGCDYRQEIYPEAVELRYVLDDERVVDSYRVDGWCQGCQSVNPVERLPSLEDLANELLETRKRGDSCDQVVLALGWRAARRSPRRCLTCGDLRTEPLDWHPIDRHKVPETACPVSVAAGFRHSCKGLLLRQYDESIRIESGLVRYLMTSEGEVIGEGPVAEDDGIL